MNLYTYVANDPLNMTDPTGMCSKENSDSSIACSTENFINDKIATPIANATFAAADAIRGAVGADAVERQDLGGEAAQAHEGPAEFSALNEVSTLGPKVAMAGVQRYNPVKSAKGVTAAVGRKGRSKNHLGPDPNAQGPHSTFRRDADGNITNTATYTPNPRNPSGFDQVGRTDVTGKPHFNKSTGQSVPTPHVQGRSIPGGVRPARPDEIPGRVK